MENLFYNDFDTTLFDAPGPNPTDSSDHRNLFQIDRDRVIFSHVFRRLQSKTQVFQSGEYDFYRTRLTHSIEVARIGRSICEYLKVRSPRFLSDTCFIDPDLLEAVGLSHDLGHPPFGHIGERKLNQLMADYGGFEGNGQTLRILTQLIYARKTLPQGMRPTRAFLDGVLKYKTLFAEAKEANKGELPKNHFIYDEQEKERDFAIGKIPDGIENINRFKSIECQVMDWADDTAYCLHDILDGIKAGFLTATAIEQWAEGKQIGPVENKYLESLLEKMKQDRIEAVFSKKVGDFIRACSLEGADNFVSEKSNRYRFKLRIQPEIKLECALYKDIALDLIFRSPQLHQIEFKGGFILEKLWEVLDEQYLGSRKPKLNILPNRVAHWVTQEPTVRAKARRICDFLSDLTDHEAIRLYKRLFDPDFGSITDLT